MTNNTSHNYSTINCFFSMSASASNLDFEEVEIILQKVIKIASNKFLILLNLMGSMIVISSSSWFSVWIGIELSSMSIPPLMMSFNSSMISKINSWKYFMIQCYSSSIFFLSIVCMSFSSTSSSYSDFLWILIITSMLFKMGIVPFHGWMVHLSLSTPWTMFLIISTIQKIGPLVIISESFSALANQFSTDLLISVIVSLVSIHMILTNNTRLFMMASSMINSAWMIASTQVSKFSFISFIIFYFFHLFILFIFLDEEFSNSLDAMFYMKSKEMPIEMTKWLIVLSLIGMPPLVGFFMKMSIIEQLISSSQTISALVLLLSSSIMMLMYLKMIVASIFNLRMETFQFSTKPISISLIIIIFSSSSMFFLIYEKYFKMK